MHFPPAFHPGYQPHLGFRNFFDRGGSEKLKNGLYTPPFFCMEPENDGFKNESPFAVLRFSGEPGVSHFGVS